MDYDVEFISYSLIGMLDDVDVIIFDEVNYKPWNEVKYMHSELYNKILNLFHIILKGLNTFGIKIAIKEIINNDRKINILY